jgi:hypothetical protein
VGYKKWIVNSKGLGDLSGGKCQIALIISDPSIIFIKSTFSS